MLKTTPITFTGAACTQLDKPQRPWRTALLRNRQYKYQPGQRHAGVHATFRKLKWFAAVEKASRQRLKLPHAGVCTRLRSVEWNVQLPISLQAIQHQNVCLLSCRQLMTSAAQHSSSSRTSRTARVRMHIQTATLCAAGRPQQTSSMRSMQRTMQAEWRMQRCRLTPRMAQSRQTSRMSKWTRRCCSPAATFRTGRHSWLPIFPLVRRRLQRIPASSAAFHSRPKPESVAFGS